MKIRPYAWLLLAVLAACSGSKVPGEVELMVTASLGLNPTPADGRPSPVVVSLYELASTSAFADFFQLAGDAPAVLGEDLLGQDAFNMRPGTSQEIVRRLDPETRFLGIVAADRAIERANWRVPRRWPPTAPRRSGSSCSHWQWCSRRIEAAMMARRGGPSRDGCHVLG